MAMDTAQPIGLEEPLVNCVFESATCPIATLLSVICPDLFLVKLNSPPSTSIDKSLNIESDVDHVAILHFVFLAFQAQAAFVPGSGHAAQVQ